LPKDFEFFSTKNGQSDISLAAPDVNLYLALNSMLTSAKSDTKLDIPNTYAEAVHLFSEMVKESSNPNVDQYYLKVFEHELKEFEEYYSEWEANRVY
jgi:glutamine synthetase